MVYTVCAFLSSPLQLQYFHAFDITIWTSLNERPQIVNSYFTVPSFILALALYATSFIMESRFPPREIIREQNHQLALPATFSCLIPQKVFRMAARLEGSIEPSGVANHLASREWRLKITRSASFLRKHQIMTLTVSSDAIIPNNDGSRCPLDSGLNILRKRNVIIKKLEEIITFLFLEPYNTPHELLVHEQCLFASGRVCSDHRMSVGNGITTHNAATSKSVLCLLMGRVNSLEPMQTLLELWRQSVVGFGLVDETGITACWRAVQKVQECGSWRLLFVGYVTVPGYAVCALLEVIFGSSVCCGSVDQVDFWEALGCARGRVNV